MQFWILRKWRFQCAPLSHFLWWETAVKSSFFSGFYQLKRTSCRELTHLNVVFFFLNRLRGYQTDGVAYGHAIDYTEGKRTFPSLFPCLVPFSMQSMPRDFSVNKSNGNNIELMKRSISGRLIKHLRKPLWKIADAMKL